MAKKNQVGRISLAGGLVGALATNPRRALENEIEKKNEDGWNATFIVPHSGTNLFIQALRVAVLVCTLGLWTFGSGYLILYEKERVE